MIQTVLIYHFSRAARAGRERNCHCAENQSFPKDEVEFFTGDPDRKLSV
jgi:hypothetical protein